MDRQARIQAGRRGRTRRRAAFFAGPPLGLLSQPSAFKALRNSLATSILCGNIQCDFQPLLHGAPRTASPLIKHFALPFFSTNYKLTNLQDLSFDNHPTVPRVRSEEHTSELQSLTNLVCRL